MRYFLDTEFLEDGQTIMPISLALVSETARELYFEFEFDLAKAKAHPFVSKHILPHLTGQVRSREEACAMVEVFVGQDPDPQFWGWYASYDWVLLCQLYGTMMDLPEQFPYFIRDLKQVCAEEGVPDEVLPPIPSDQHHALADARWLCRAYGAVAGWRGAR